MQKEPAEKHPSAAFRWSSEQPQQKTVTEGSTAKSLTTGFVQYCLQPYKNRIAAGDVPESNAVLLILIGFAVRLSL